jgi:hypothetical protein
MTGLAIFVTFILTSLAWGLLWALINIDKDRNVRNR